jgi:hypothetical protein
MLAARYGHDSTIRLLIPHITHPIESFRTANGRSAQSYTSLFKAKA